MRKSIIKEIVEIWKTLSVKDDDVSLRIKKATFKITFVSSFFFGIFYGCLYYYLEAFKTSIFEFVILFTFFPVAVFLNKRVGHNAAAHFFLFTYTILLSVCAYFTGGIHSPSYIWLLIPPFIASVILNTKETVTWGIITMVNILSIGILYMNNFIPISEISPSSFQIFYIFSFVALVIYVLGYMVVTNYMRLKIVQEFNTLRENSQRNDYLATFAQVTAGVAHEINNPLTIALASIKKLSKKENLNDNQSIDFFNKTTVSLERISDIVKSMRNLSRDGSTDSVRRFKISEIIDDVTNVFLTEFESKEINLIREKSHLESIEVEANKVQLGQVLLNLIKNSTDEIEDLGEKWIRIALDIIKEDNQQSHLLLKIYDSGKGVDEDKLDLVFAPFFTTKDVGKGTGLGLSLSHTMMLKSKGDLYYENSKNENCFVMKVPV